MAPFDSPAEILTPDVFVVAFSFLELRDLMACSRVSREFYTCTLDQSLWESFACRRFGSRLVASTIPLYHGNYHKMMADDNLLGALPTLLHVKPSHWTLNVPNQRYFCCHIPCIKWDRLARTLLLYFDVIGEVDLRHPRNSRIGCHPLHRPPLPAVTPHGFLNNAAESCHILYEYQESQGRRRRHYQGYLVFPDTIFSIPGTYKFCFGNQFLRSPLSDYEAVHLLTVADGERGLSIAAFEREGGNSRKVYYTTKDPPIEQHKSEANEQQSSSAEEKEVTWFHPRPPF
jgi:hypothetical protein